VRPAPCVAEGKAYAAWRSAGAYPAMLVDGVTVDADTDERFLLRSARQEA
jgi:hypothetical protein